MYAQPLRRLSQERKQEAFIEAHDFAIEIGHTFSRIEKDTINWCAVFNCEDGDEAGAAIVICPNCNETQVCWGEYGDPATENCVCSDCHQAYETEPF